MTLIVVTLGFEMIDLRLQRGEAFRLAVHDLPERFHQRFETGEALGDVSQRRSVRVVSQRVRL